MKKLLAKIATLLAFQSCEETGVRTYEIRLNYEIVTFPSKGGSIEILPTGIVKIDGVEKQSFIIPADDVEYIPKAGDDSFLTRKGYELSAEPLNGGAGEVVVFDVLWKSKGVTAYAIISQHRD